MKKLNDINHKYQNPTFAIGATMSPNSSAKHFKHFLRSAPLILLSSAAIQSPVAVAQNPTGLGFPASVPMASEQLLALINDERGACKPTPPSLDAVFRLLTQGANPDYDKFPFGDYGTVIRRAQLCGFSEVWGVLSRYSSVEPSSRVEQSK